jgi:hypothetical protein
MAAYAAPSSLTPLTLQTVVAGFFVAALVAVGILALYAVVAGGLAWVLMLLVGVVRLAAAVIGAAWWSVRTHVRRKASGLAVEPAADLRLRPLG